MKKSTGLQSVLTEKLSKRTIVTDWDNVNLFAFLRFHLANKLYSSIITIQFNTIYSIQFIQLFTLIQRKYNISVL